MNVLIETRDGLHTATPEDAATQLAEAEKAVAAARAASDELGLRRAVRRARGLYAVVHPEVAYDEVIYE